MNANHPYAVGQVIGDGIFRRVFVGTYGVGALRFCYLVRVNGQFYLEQSYGGGSFASSGDAWQALAFWDGNNLNPDLCREIRKAIAEWPGIEQLIQLVLEEAGTVEFWYGEYPRGGHIYLPNSRKGTQLAYGQRSMVEAMAREYERHGYKVRIVE